MSDDARYMVFDSRSFEPVDVGNLWWLGIRNVDWVVRGSDFHHAGLLTTSTPEPVPEDSLRPTSYFVSLENLGQSKREWSDLPVRRVSDAVKMWWIAGDVQHRLIAFEWDRAANSTLRVLSPELDEEFNWQVTYPSIGLGLACASENGDVLVSGLTKMMVGNSLAHRLNSYPPKYVDQGFHLGSVAVGCFGILFKVPDTPLKELDPETALTEIAILDLQENKVISSLKMHRFSKYRLFDRGTQLLQQDLEVVEFDEYYLSARWSPTNRLQVLNLSSSHGAQVKRMILPEPGTISPIFCGDTPTPKVVISAGQTLYLVNLRDMIVEASRQIPFDKYFVF